MYIQVSHLTKSFGGQEVLRDVTFTVGSRERVGLLGQNGSGKSTIFKIIMGEESPDAGQVSIQPKNSLIGFLPQVIDDASPLSSGQKLQKRFQEVLAGHPDILLLDEPTNHLDWPSLQWLEKSILSFSGPVVIISHDRYFLDQTVTKILELQNGQIKTYGGNYTSYKQQKLVQLDAASRDYREQQSRVKKLEDRTSTIKNRTQQLEVSTTGTDHYARRKAAKAAKSAISMEKRISKELQESRLKKPEPNWELKALFKPKQAGSQTVLRVTGVNYAQILKNINLHLQSGQRLALVGKNGSGKTTLIKLIRGEIVPDSGEIQIGNGIDIGYLSQEHQELSSLKSVLDELMSESVDRTAGYQLLRRFLLPPEKIHQPVNSLSSGEKAKLLLAKIMTLGANFIILDEPTNHLDIPSREALEESLSNYSGTLLVVSHDQYFLAGIGITTFYQL